MTSITWLKCETRLVIPRRWNQEGDIVLALSVPPNFVSRVVLCNYGLELNETLWESSISRGDAHIDGLFWSDTLTQSYGPWLVMQYAYTVRPRLFDNLLFEYPALSEVDRRSRFYLYMNQYKYERIIQNALSEYLLSFEVKFLSRLYNYERISHLLFEASLIIIWSQTNGSCALQIHSLTGRLVKNINSHACI
jgi:hypothetical protein